MNDKTKATIIPIIIFIITVVVGSFIVVYSFNIDSTKDKSNVYMEQVENNEQVMGVQTEAVEDIAINDAMKFSIESPKQKDTFVNNVPICESFKNITEKDKEESDKYLKDKSFSFEVIGYEIDTQDSLSFVKYSIIDSKTNSSVKDYECSIKENNKFDDGTVCDTTAIGDTSSVLKYKNILSNFKFPDTGDYFVKASVVSSDGGFTRCAVSKVDE